VNGDEAQHDIGRPVGARRNYLDAALYQMAAGHLCTGNRLTGVCKRAIGQLTIQQLDNAPQSPTISERFSNKSAEPVGRTLGPIAAVIRADLGKWSKVTKDTGIKPK